MTLVTSLMNIKKKWFIKTPIKRTEEHAVHKEHGKRIMYQSQWSVAKDFRQLSFPARKKQQQQHLQQIQYVMVHKYVWLDKTPSIAKGAWSVVRDSLPADSVADIDTDQEFDAGLLSIFHISGGKRSHRSCWLPHTTTDLCEGWLPKERIFTGNKKGDTLFRWSALARFITVAATWDTNWTLKRSSLLLLRETLVFLSLKIGCTAWVLPRFLCRIDWSSRTARVETPMVSCTDPLSSVKSCVAVFQNYCPLPSQNRVLGSGLPLKQINESIN